MEPRAPARFSEALAVLHRHGVPFIVIGGVAAVLEGAPVVTFDLDILVRQGADDLTKLLDALTNLESLYRDPAGHRIEPTVERLRGARLSLFKTRCGDLDVLAEIGAGETYESLLPRSHPVTLGDAAIRVLDLEAIVETKEHANRPKDRAVLFDLKETLRLRGGR